MVSAASATQSSLPLPPRAPESAVSFSVGLDGTPQGQLPIARAFTPAEAENARNPLQYLPVVGMFYRAVTGETVPAALTVGSSVITGAAFGGPVGALGSALFSLATELFRLGPDTTRPAAPAGMDVGGGEVGVRPVTPGTLASGAYTTLATTLPDFLGGPVGNLVVQLAQNASTTSDAGGEPAGAMPARLQRAAFAYNAGNMMAGGSG